MPAAIARPGSVNQTGPAPGTWLGCRTAPRWGRAAPQPRAGRLRPEHGHAERRDRARRRV